MIIEDFDSSMSDSLTYTKGLNMSSLRSAIGSFGLFIAVTAASLPALAAPQPEDAISSASTLGTPVSVSDAPLNVESAPTTSLIKKVNGQLDTTLARNSSPQEQPSFRWKSELLDSQRRSEPGFKFVNSKF